MKRILLLTMLLVLAFGAQSVLAAPFAFGPSGFDDSADLKTNLETLLEGPGSKIHTVNLNPGDFHDMHMSLMAVSHSAMDANFAIFNSSDQMIASAASIGSDWGSFSYGDLSSYTIKFDGGPAEGISLDQVLTVAYTFGDEIVYKPVGDYDGLVIEEGYFLGLDLFSSGGLDFVLGFGYEPFAPAVPVPAAVWLFGTGLAGLYAVRKRSN